MKRIRMKRLYGLGAVPARGLATPANDLVPPKKKTQHEKKLQKLGAQFMDVALPEDSLYLVIPGGAARRTRHPGYKKGTPDKLTVWRGFAFFIEYKAGKGKLSDDQVELHARLIACGAKVAVIKSLEALERQLLDWGIPLRARVIAGGAAWVLAKAA